VLTVLQQYHNTIFGKDEKVTLTDKSNYDVLLSGEYFVPMSALEGDNDESQKGAIEEESKETSAFTVWHALTTFQQSLRSLSSPTCSKRS
jgi:hypothetical protein